MAKKGEIIASLDIGTSDTRCIASEVKEDGEVEVIGVGTQKSSGMSNGSITNIEETVHSIRSAVEDAELMAGVQISDVFVGISGPHIKGENSDGVVPIKGKEIEQSDIDRVLEQANAVPIPMDRKVLHTKVQEYIVDDQAGVKVPLGISGVRLKTRVHIITAAASAMQNIEPLLQQGRCERLRYDFRSAGRLLRHIDASGKRSGLYLRGYRRGEPRTS